MLLRPGAPGPGLGAVPKCQLALVLALRDRMPNLAAPPQLYDPAFNQVQILVQLPRTPIQTAIVPNQTIEESLNCIIWCLIREIDFPSLPEGALGGSINRGLATQTQFGWYYEHYLNSS